MKALVIGYGSIGKRHAGILSSMDAVSNVAVLSSQPNLPYETIKTLEEIPKLRPDYIVIASITTRHYDQMVFLEEHLSNRKILIEKPLFNSFHDLDIHKNHVFVGYNLRFHPLLQLIKEKIAGKNLWNIHVICGSYLPEWRPGRDYRETSSAKKETGGGVLLDLSHELDYVKWLGGPIGLNHVVNEKVSDLEIETDDLLLLCGRSSRSAHVYISLNYFTRQPTRQILIDGEGICIQANLIANKVSIYEQGVKSEFAWPELQRNDTYQAQHKAIIAGDYSYVCTYSEGLETMRLIDDIKSYRTE